MKRGLLPFVADNRIHVVPPCTVTDAEVKKALAIYEEAFARWRPALDERSRELARPRRRSTRA